MRIVIDTENADVVSINNKSVSIIELDGIFDNIIKENEIDSKKYTINNKYLRAIIRKDAAEYHILEKPCGINNIHFLGKDSKKHTAKFDMPNTIMILKFCEKNGEYYKIADRIFHTEYPLNEKMDNSLYKWGLSNVYKEGYICWGKEEMDHIEKDNSYLFVDEFFLNIKNTDLMTTSKYNWNTVDESIVNPLEISDLIKVDYSIAELLRSTNF